MAWGAGHCHGGSVPMQKYCTFYKIPFSREKVQIVMQLQGWHGKNISSSKYLLYVVLWNIMIFTDNISDTVFWNHIYV